VLETRKVERLGATGSLDVDVRILSATNKDLPAEIARQSFREDLYFRLRVVLLRLPPCASTRGYSSARPRVLPHARWKSTAARAGGFTPGMERPDGGEWRGNVRELKTRWKAPR